MQAFVDAAVVALALAIAVFGYAVAVRRSAAARRDENPRTSRPSLHLVVTDLGRASQAGRAPWRAVGGADGRVEARSGCANRELASVHRLPRSGASL